MEILRADEGNRSKPTISANMKKIGSSEEAKRGKRDGLKCSQYLTFVAIMV